VERSLPELESWKKRQKVLADFGEFMLRSHDLDEVLTEACRLVSDAMGTNRAKVLERLAERFVVRAGIGWAPGVVGTAIPMSERSSETHALELGAPVIINDMGKEDRFDVASFMKEAGVVALANVPIFLPRGEAYGLLQVDDVVPRDFDEGDIEFLRTYASLLGSIIDRLMKERELSATEERFRLVVENARDYAIFLTDPQDRITDWFPGAAEIFQWSAEEAVGQPGAVLFTPEDRLQDEDIKELETARREGVSPNVRWHQTKMGARVFIEGSMRRLDNPDGSVRGFLKIGQDVTERRRREERLLASEERFRQFGEHSSDVIWIRDAESLAMEYVSPAFDLLYGLPRDQLLTGDTVALWLERIHPQDRDDALEKIKSVRGGERITHEFRIFRLSDGELRWIENTDFPITDHEGRVRLIAGIAKDVTENKASAARLEVLVDELQHRSRNLLGVVNSIASKTLANGGSIADYQVRLQALSRAQALLSQFGSDTVEIGALVRTELAAHTPISPPKVNISGPKVHLTARQVQNYALAVHELATNAVKYGALRSPDGLLSVHWRLEQDRRDRQRLVLTWSERGVAIPPGARERRGYGRELIENALSYALGAKTEFEIGDEGVRCRIDLPLN
jgi:PAS domain S-box-containing protein